MLYRQRVLSQLLSSISDNVFRFIYIAYITLHLQYITYLLTLQCLLLATQYLSLLISEALEPNGS